MSYELRQRIGDIGDFDPEGLAEFFEEKTDLRLVFDPSSEDYLILEDADAPERKPEVPVIDRQRLPLDLDPAVDARNPFTLDDDIDVPGIRRLGACGVAETSRLYNAAESNGGGDE